MDFKLFIESLLTGTPVAILAALVGMVWQAFYVRSRDRFHDEQMRRELELERRKFEHQKELETLHFEYEQRRWREELARNVTTTIVEARIEEFSKIWAELECIAAHRFGDDKLTPEITQKLAQQIKSWRYTKGGLLAESTTRDAAFALQAALSEFDGSKKTYTSMRLARSVFRDALRADMGLGEDIRGQTIFEALEKRQKIRKELEELQAKLGITFAEEA